MIHDKPFDPKEMLRKTIFLGRPNFFNARDLNKEFETVHSFMEKFNEKFAVVSNINITFNTFGEVLNQTVNPPVIERTFHFNNSKDTILYKGVEFQLDAGGQSATHSFPVPNTQVSPKEVSPPTYIVLKGDLNLITYAQDTELCGITSDETPNSVPTVDVEQYQNVSIGISTDLTEENIICIVGTIHPRYKDDGTPNGFGFIRNSFRNEFITIDNGVDRQKSQLKSNKSLFELLIEKLSLKFSRIVNERQLVRRFHLSDIIDFAKARHNLGFSELVNRRQLVRAENLKDIPDPAYARKHLGLGNSAVMNVGTTALDVARGDIIKIGMIVMWYGSPTQIPEGWKQCNGLDGTPDMRGRFPVGYDFTNNDYLMGQTGGAKEVTLTGAQSGTAPHNHPVNDPGHSHELSIPAGKQEVARSGNGNAYRTENWSVQALINSSKTGITVGDSVGKSATEAHENRPPYFSVMFIIYVGIAPVELPTLPTLPTQPDLTYPNFSTPTIGNTGTDGGYSNYDYDAITNADYVDLGAGVILTNPD